MTLNFELTNKSMNSPSQHIIWTKNSMLQIRIICLRVVQTKPFLKS